jgi:hypothetical protein
LSDKNWLTSGVVDRAVAVVIIINANVSAARLGIASRFIFLVSSNALGNKLTYYV